LVVGASKAETTGGLTGRKMMGWGRGFFIKRRETTDPPRGGLGGGGGGPDAEYYLQVVKRDLGEFRGQRKAGDEGEGECLP